MTKAHDEERPIHAFAGGQLDRRAQLRQQAHHALTIIKLVGDRVLLAQGATGQVELAYFHEAGASNLVHLGVRDNGQAIMAQALPEGEPPKDHVLIDLRSLAMQGLLETPELAMLAQARSLLSWHERHGFCANCGAATLFLEGGYRRDCPSCKTQHFPRTDPVVITAITGPRGVLLGRGHGFLPLVYSALAGFVEPGESIEEAAQREIFEETGIRVFDVRYHSSQPWPFPSSLMIGLLARTEGGEIVIDRSELQDARWFGRAELNDMLHDRHSEGLKVPRPAAIAHHLIRAAVDEIEE